jgi:hypothetical protein
MGGTAVYIGQKRIHGNKVGVVAWHQYFGGKMNNVKLAGKLASVWINNNNIFHTLPSAHP